MMSLTEYLNQKDPQRSSIGSVHLLPSEYQLFPSGVPKLNHVVFKMFGKHLSYVTKPLSYVTEDRIVLYTSDDDGNPQSPSCFSIPSN